MVAQVVEVVANDFTFVVDALGKGLADIRAGVIDIADDSAGVEKSVRGAGIVG